MGSLFDHLRLARQRSLAGRRPGMGGGRRSMCDAEQGDPLPNGSAGCRGRGPVTPTQSSVRSLLGCGGDALMDDSFQDEEAVNETLAQLLFVMERLDDKIGPMLEQDGHHFSKRWGRGAWGTGEMHVWGRCREVVRWQGRTGWSPPSSHITCQSRHLGSTSARATALLAAMLAATKPHQPLPLLSRHCCPRARFSPFPFFLAGGASCLVPA